ncbi:elongation of very long chain fatty acids protein [Culex pipiens pallens]|uniref:elongation of very long chain fatty acids protein n=1 Tax=Culex pipiens pallens TaxID=42434 RepID=UPI001954A6F0|nr:elongation of very long chain fatty acids protein [Culex pipiens pallens]XP_052564612.1 elongation of very long chain fatty acids protein [Culex pipiens pallens]XP_052564613.1 elongation of very long chain fatty acids protein [Culex pipiens pallens]
MTEAVADSGIFHRIAKFFVENQDERTTGWFLSGSMTPLIIILVTYLYFCLYAGPRYMAKRKPFKLEGVLIAYNAIQVVLSIWLVYEGIMGGWNGVYNLRCQPVDYSRDPLAMRMAGAVWAYYICKVVELLDTVFFVLRKKQNQVSFLHLYHHTLMPVCGFVGVKYFAGGHGTLLGVINSFIHVCMYAYYMLAAMGPKVQQYLWWKPYLTKMQIVQFVIVFFHTLQVQFQPTCGYPKSIAALLTLNAALFIYMFSMFYVKSYLRAAKRPAKGTEVNNNNLLDCKPKQELEQTAVAEEVDSRQRLVASGEEKKDL